MTDLIYHEETKTEDEIRQTIIDRLDVVDEHMLAKIHEMVMGDCEYDEKNNTYIVTSWQLKE